MVTHHEFDILVVGHRWGGVESRHRGSREGVDVLVVCMSPAGYNNAIVVVGGRFQGGYEGTDFG